MTILELNHVGFRYRPDRPVLEDVNCRFETGVFYALVGKSGAGKSTLLSLMAGLDLPTEGEILFEGRSTAGMDLSEYRRRYASVIYQDFALLPLLTVQENIQYPMALCGVPPQEAAQQARELARRVSLPEELLDRYPSRISGGEQQRVQLARCLAQLWQNGAPQGWLFLDEPTTYLDISHQLDILYLLRRLNRENGVTIVMVLHDLNHAIMFSDYLVAIKDGMLHSAGTPQEVITQQALREIFDVEAEVITHPVLNVPVCLPFRITEQNKKQEVRTHEKRGAISAVLRAGRCAAAVRRMRQIGRHLHGGRLYGFR